MAELSMSYQQMRAANEAREADAQRTANRKKGLLILMLDYLATEGYRDSVSALSRETNIDLSKFEICDNVDIETILMEYESYYLSRYGKLPKIMKKRTSMPGDGGKYPKSNTKKRSKPALAKIPEVPSSPSREHQAPGSTRGALQRPKPKATQSSSAAQTNNSAGTCGPSMSEGFMVQGQSVKTAKSAAQEPPADQNVPRQKMKPGQVIDVRAMLNDVTRLSVEEGSESFERLLQPMGGYAGYDAEWRDLARTISRDIYLHDPQVKWNDIIGLDEAKKLVKEAVVYPIKYPKLFRGILSPWKGLLLYGPPGTGKTLLAKAVATECKTTFFNISASTIVSKWRGDSEKLVRVLFELARYHAPSTIFIDELESIIGQRGSTSGAGEHEGSRRMKTELLIQMDGLAKTEDLVFLLGASNIPWELDQAMLRRLEKRILVDLPTHEARKSMIQQHLPSLDGQREQGPNIRAELDYDLLAEKTEGYSGSDVKLVCKEAAMIPVRKIFKALEQHAEGEELQIKMEAVTTADVLRAIEHTKPSAQQLKAGYRAWQKQYESA